MNLILKTGERSRIWVSKAWWARSMMVLPVLHGLFLFSFEAVKAEQKDSAKTIVGKTTVVVADDFEHGRSERWYFITDQVTGKSVRLYFDGAPPASFVTGAQFEARIVPVQDGFRPLDLTEIKSGNLDSSIKSQQLDAEPYRGAVLTILVDFNDARVGGPGVDWGVTIQDAKGFMFNDVQSVAGLFESASLGRVLLDPDKNSDGQPDVFGPYEIDASINEEYCPFYDWMDKAKAVWQADNPSIDSSSYQHIVYIFPNYRDFPNSCWWRGIASVACEQCWAISTGIGKSPYPGITLDVGLITAHEIGHNFSLDHAATDTNNNDLLEQSNEEHIYSDVSDIMGWAEGWVKLNGPHAYMKGWTDPLTYEIRSTNQTIDPQSLEFLSMDDEAADWPGLRGIKLPRDLNSTYYVTYRLNAGIYDEVPHGGYGVPNGWADRINVHYVPVTFANYTFFVTSLGPGETFRDSNADLRIIAGEQKAITDGEGHSTQVMGVEICQYDCGETKITVDVLPNELLACIEGNNVDLDPLTLSVKSIDGVSEMVSLDFASELPSELTGTISPKAVASSSEGTMSVASFAFAGDPTPLTDVIRIEGFPKNGYPRGVDINLGVFDQKPGPITLSLPIDGDPNVDRQSAFSWEPAAGAHSYLLEISKNQDFSQLWLSKTVRDTEYGPVSGFPLETTIYWRVTPINACGQPETVPIRSFVTQSEGVCPASDSPVIHFKDNFERNNNVWTHESILGAYYWEWGPGTWELSTEKSVSPVHAWQANKVNFSSDQRLISPIIDLPQLPGEAKLEFWTKVSLAQRESPDTCFDGGTLEYSTNQGIDWEQVPIERLKTYPYTAEIDGTQANPLDDLRTRPYFVWCGRNNWIRSVVDLNGLQGSQIQFRFRLGTGTFIAHGSWRVDDVKVYSCVSSELIHIFKDGFESGE